MSGKKRAWALPYLLCSNYLLPTFFPINGNPGSSNAMQIPCTSTGAVNEAKASYARFALSPEPSRCELLQENAYRGKMKETPGSDPR